MHYIIYGMISMSLLLQMEREGAITCEKVEKQGHFG